MTVKSSDEQFIVGTARVKCLCCMEYEKAFICFNLRQENAKRINILEGITKSAGRHRIPREARGNSLLLTICENSWLIWFDK